MKFPFHPKHLEHKFGGKITEITGIGHKTDRPVYGSSRDFWYFIGTVVWDDSGKQSTSEIEPGRVCYCENNAEGKAEFEQMLTALNVYLAEHGEWYGVESKHQGWYAHRKVKATSRRQRSGARGKVKVS